MSESLRKLLKTVSILHFRYFSNVFEISGLTIGEDAKKALELEKHGLGVITAAIFLAGEMAGSGVLALPNAMAGTGTYSLYFPS